MVIVFDDLHWADSASLDLLLNVAELAGKLPFWSSACYGR